MESVLSLNIVSRSTLPSRPTAKGYNARFYASSTKPLEPPKHDYPTSAYPHPAQLLTAAAVNGDGQVTAAGLSPSHPVMDMPTFLRQFDHIEAGQVLAPTVAPLFLAGECVCLSEPRLCT